MPQQDQAGLSADRLTDVSVDEMLRDA